MCPAGSHRDREAATPLVHPEYLEEILSAQALKRTLVPEDVARLVLFLAADDSEAITNQSYVIDGGWV